MSLHSVEVIYDYKTLLSVCANLVKTSIKFFYFLEHSYSLKEPYYLLYLTIPSQWCPYVTLDIVFLSAVPPLGAVLYAMFSEYYKRPIHISKKFLRNLKQKLQYCKIRQIKILFPYIKANKINTL